MRFKYNIKNNYFKMYGEGNYLLAFKKKYLKNYNKPIKNYILSNIYRLIGFIFLTILYKIIGIDFLLMPILLISIFAGNLILFSLVSYYKYKKGCHKGEIIIDDKGITDNSDITITFPWKNVELIGVTNTTLIIIVNHPFIILLEPNEKIIKEILKYKEVKVIRN